MNDQKSNLSYKIFVVYLNFIIIVVLKDLLSNRPVIDICALYKITVSFIKYF
jgi:hypothetical protein